MDERRDHRRQLAAMVALFLRHHEHCLTSPGGEFTLATTVPSTRTRPDHASPAADHPLTHVVGMVRRLRDLHQPVLRRGTGRVDHLQASDTAFTAVRPLHRERILLIDDTFTSGARMQSAASALTLAGAKTVTALAIGRIIGPDFNDNCRAIWERANNTPFTFDRCCRCAS